MYPITKIAYAQSFRRDSTVKSPQKIRNAPRPMGRGVFLEVPDVLMGTSKNAPFAIWLDLHFQLCAAEIPQYTKYSGISAT